MLRKITFLAALGFSASLFGNHDNCVIESKCIQVAECGNMGETDSYTLGSYQEQSQRALITATTILTLREVETLACPVWNQGSTSYVTIKRRLSPHFTHFYGYHYTNKHVALVEELPLEDRLQALAQSEKNCQSGKKRAIFGLDLCSGNE